MRIVATSRGRYNGGTRLADEFHKRLGWRLSKQEVLDLRTFTSERLRKKQQSHVPANRSVDQVAFLGGEFIAAVVFLADIFEAFQQFFVGQVARAWSSMGPLLCKELQSTRRMVKDGFVV